MTERKQDFKIQLKISKYFSHDPIRDLRQSCMTIGVRSVRDNGMSDGIHVLTKTWHNQTTLTQTQNQVLYRRPIYWLLYGE